MKQVKNAKVDKDQMVSNVKSTKNSGKNLLKLLKSKEAEGRTL